MSDGIYSPEFLHHLFYGHVKRKRKGRKGGWRKILTGIHYVGANAVASGSVRIVEAQSSKPDSNGVRVALVEVTRDGITARRQSTLFPSDWTRAQVLSAIREVYSMRPHSRGGSYWGTMSSAGIHITLRFNGAGKIVTAWPERTKKKEKKYSPCRLRHSRAWRARLYERDGLSYSGGTQ
jgi:hypothetical protein